MAYYSRHAALLCVCRLFGLSASATVREVVDCSFENGVLPVLLSAGRKNGVEERFGKTVFTITEEQKHVEISAAITRECDSYEFQVTDSGSFEIIFDNLQIRPFRPDGKSACLMRNNSVKCAAATKQQPIYTLKYHEN